MDPTIPSIVGGNDERSTPDDDAPIAEAGDAPTVDVERKPDGGEEEGKDEHAINGDVKVEPMETTEEPKTEEAVSTPPRPLVTRPAVRPVRGGGNMPMLEQTGALLIGPGGTDMAQALGINQPKLRRWRQEIVDSAKKYAMEQSVKHIMQRQTNEHQENQTKIAMFSQSLSLMARIYCGCVPYDVREDGLRTLFAPFGPVKSINMSYDTMTGTHKGFAFLEFEVPESAVIAIDQMNGINAGGKQIKVGKPTNLPQTQPIIEQITTEAKKTHRVFVASVHADLTEAELRTVFEAFGAVTDCTLAKLSPTGKMHRGYGYITYPSAQSAIDAVASMNMFDLGGQFLRVGMAVTPPWAQAFSATNEVHNLPTASVMAAASVSAKICAATENNVYGASSAAATPKLIAPLMSASGSTNSLTAMSPFTSQLMIRPPPPVVDQGTSSPSSKFGARSDAVPPPTVVLPTIAPRPSMMMNGNGIALNHPAPLVATMATRSTNSRVIVLRNMVTANEVDASLEEEIKEECGNFGTVQAVVVFLERFGAGVDDVVVKIFVRFEHAHEAEVAVSKMNGRFFAGKTIVARIYDENLFAHNDYSG